MKELLCGVAASASAAVYLGLSGALLPAPLAVVFWGAFYKRNEIGWVPRKGSMTNSENSLQRFIQAQETDYSTALAELRQGKKRSHWMWYIFPQLRGLGFSSTAQFYGLQDGQEARAFLQHPLLGRRLLELCQVLVALPGQNATNIMGSPDDLKLRSCMTLFAAVDPAQPLFQQVLDKFYQGQPDPQTLRLLQQAAQ